MITPIRTEDVMTPRNVLKFASSDGEAEAIATKSGFDAVPLARKDGKILEFWNRLKKRRMRIGRAHRTAHDKPVEAVLPRLGDHTVQFVYYRSEIVGLVDASDLNRPIARIAWLQPMLELEREILDALRRLGISDAEQAAALGRQEKGARTRQRRAQRESLDLPLLEYAQFPDLLSAARRLGILEMSEPDIPKLNEVRKRAAHSGDVVVQTIDDCGRLREALQIARTESRQVSSRRMARRQ